MSVDIRLERIVEATSDLRVGGAWRGAFGPTRDEMYSKTRLVVEDTGYPTEAQRDAHQNGWPAFLDNYERHVTRA